MAGDELVFFFLGTKGLCFYRALAKLNTSNPIADK